MKSSHFKVLFYGGPWAGRKQVFECDQGDQIVLACEHDAKGVIYERRPDYLKDGDEDEIYECVYNGASVPPGQSKHEKFKHNRRITNG